MERYQDANSFQFDLEIQGNPDENSSKLFWVYQQTDSKVYIERWKYLPSPSVSQVLGLTWGQKMKVQFLVLQGLPFPSVLQSKGNYNPSPSNSCSNRTRLIRNPLVYGSCSNNYRTVGFEGFNGGVCKVQIESPSQRWHEKRELWSGSFWGARNLPES